MLRSTLARRDDSGPLDSATLNQLCCDAICCAGGPMSHGSMVLTYQKLSLGHSIVSRRDRSCEKCTVNLGDEDAVRVRRKAATARLLGGGAGSVRLRSLCSLNDPPTVGRMYRPRRRASAG